VAVTDALVKITTTAGGAKRSRSNRQSFDSVKAEEELPALKKQRKGGNGDSEGGNSGSGEETGVGEGGGAMVVAELGQGGNAKNGRVKVEERNGAVPTAAGSSSDIAGASEDHDDSTSLFYCGNHDRVEVVRLMIQALGDLGYNDVASMLERESGLRTESTEVADFRKAILSGEWGQAEEALGHIELQAPDSFKSMLFLIRRQHYLELLETKGVEAALFFLRSEMATLQCNKAELHSLASLALYPMDEVREQAKWAGAGLGSRKALLESFQEFVSPTVMIPPHRLGILLDQAKSYQLTKSNYFMGFPETISLYKDYVGDRNDFPTACALALTEHTDEAWFVEFSPNGKMLASSSKDQSVIIWDATKDFAVRHVLKGHTLGVPSLCWSSDSRYVVSCSLDFKAILWDVESGEQLHVISHDDVVQSCAWVPGTNQFVTCSPGKTMKLSNTDGELLYTWSDVRFFHCAVTPDARKLVVICNDNDIHIFDLASREREFTRSVADKQLTSICISKDSRFALINVVPEEVHLWDLELRRIVRKYIGQVQSDYIIRSCFGGQEENFVLSGSQDNYVYVWNRETTDLIEVLAGHTGFINCVRWNPTHSAMFATASDDKTVRIWLPKKTNLHGRMLR
jgi:hypothetical protein